MKRLVLACLFLGLSVACRQKSDSSLKDLWDDRGALVQGQSWFQSVALTINGKPFCSGVVIDSLTILTAAHCFKNDRVGLNRGLDGVEVYFGDYPKKSPGSMMLKPNLLDLHPEYDALTHERDLAKVRFSPQNPIPASVWTQYPLPRLLSRDQLGTVLGQTDPEVYLVGYGRSSYETWTPHSKREVRGTLALAQSSGTLLVPTDQGYTCPGDSGCPAFVYGPDRTLYLMGVLQGGYDWGQGQKMGFDGPVSSVTPLAPHDCWLFAGSPQALAPKNQPSRCLSQKSAPWSAIAPKALQSQGAPRCAAVTPRSAGPVPPKAVRPTCLAMIRPMRTHVVERPRLGGCRIPGGSF